MENTLNSFRGLHQQIHTIYIVRAQMSSNSDPQRGAPLSMWVGESAACKQGKGRATYENCEWRGWDSKLWIFFYIPTFSNKLRPSNYGPLHAYVVVTSFSRFLRYACDYFIFRICNKSASQLANAFRAPHINAGSGGWHNLLIGSQNKGCKTWGQQELCAARRWVACPMQMRVVTKASAFRTRIVANILWRKVTPIKSLYPLIIYRKRRTGEVRWHCSLLCHGSGF